jgi:hypothetical protein
MSPWKYIKDLRKFSVRSPMGNALPRLYGEIVLQKNIEIEKYSAF